MTQRSRNSLRRHSQPIKVRKPSQASKNDRCPYTFRDRSHISVIRGIRWHAPPGDGCCRTDLPPSHKLAEWQRMGRLQEWGATILAIYGRKSMRTSTWYTVTTGRDVRSKLVGNSIILHITIVKYDMKPPP